MPVPTRENLFNPLLATLHKLGGSGSISEIEEKVADILKLTEKEINEIHKGNRTKLNYHLAWARTYLKLCGFLENSARGIWALTPKGRKTKKVDKDEITKHVRAIISEGETLEEKTIVKKTTEENKKLWQDKLMEEVLKLSPGEFERLCQRILRESGFIKVEITGRPGDGGIDGRGIVRIGGLLGFRVIFQCKRYIGSITAEKIRNFQGTMVGRADKGLFITTGNFTRGAKKETTRDGAPSIDLIDGEQLLEKMKELELGVCVKTEEIVEVDKEWFKAF